MCFYYVWQRLCIFKNIQCFYEDIRKYSQMLWACRNMPRGLTVLHLSSFQFQIWLQSSAQLSAQSRRSSQCCSWGYCKVRSGRWEVRWPRLDRTKPRSLSTAPTVSASWGTSSVRDSMAGRSTPAPVPSADSWSSGTDYIYIPAQHLLRSLAPGGMGKK